jgi:hypothetical protein
MTHLAPVDTKRITVYLYMWGKIEKQKKSAEGSNLILQTELGRERRSSRGTEGRDTKIEEMREIWREQYRSVIINDPTSRRKKHRG